MKFIKAAFVALCLSGVASHALAAVELKSEAFREVEVTDKNGKKTKKLEPLTRAVPGQEVIYVITYRNTGKEQVSNVVVNNPVPKDLAYLVGSAKGNNTRVDVSVDGGQKYGDLETLTVKNVDGTERPATGGDVTHVRWTVTVPVKSGAEGSVSYRATLR